MTKNWAFGLVAALGLIALALKLLPASSTSYLRLSGPYSELVRSAFQREGFTTIDSSEVRYGIGAKRDACIAWVAPSEADGDNDALFSRAYGVDAEIFFLYNGQRFVVRPNIIFFVDRLKKRGADALGYPHNLRPILAVAIAHACAEKEESEVIGILSAVHL
jgi:hypothetical protein